MSDWDEAKAERQRRRRAERKANPRPGDEEAKKARSKKRWHTKRKFDVEYRVKRVEGTKQRRRMKEPPSWKKFGATMKHFLLFWEKQQGLCGICGRRFDPTRSERNAPDKPHFDHCHITMRMRGLLCFSCNSKLGWCEKYTAEIQNYLNKE